MERKRFWEQTWLGLRALAVIAVMLLTTMTAAATDYFVAEYNNSTLTFKKTTTAPDNSSSWDVSDTGTSNPGWYSYCEGIWKVVFDPSFAEARPKSCCKWFLLCQNLYSIEGLEYLNTSEVTTMADMFNYCRVLTSLDLSHFNTYKVNTMNSMFYYCSYLKTLCIGNEFYVGNLVDTDSMFGGCDTLTGANGTLRVRGMKPVINKDIFTGFEGTLMTDDDLDGSWCGGTFNTVKRMRAYAQLSGSTLTFKYEEHPSALGDNEWDVSNTGVGLGNYGWQSNNIDITQVVFAPSFSDARPKSCSKWFYACYDLTTIEGIEYLNTSEVTSMFNMFGGCSSLTSLDVSRFNTSQVTDMSYMFANCGNLANLDVSHFDTHNVTNFVSMFNGCKGLTSLDVSHFNTSKAVAVGWMFQDCSGLTSLDVSHFNTRNVSEDYTRSMQNMFAGCSSLTSLDLSSFDTSNATNMNCMFQGCSSLQTLNLSSFDTGNVKDMYGMFDGCNSLQSLDLSTFNTSQVTNMYGMFKNCSNLACLSIGSGFAVNETTDYTNKVGYTRTENMFSGCTALPEGTLIVKGTTAPSIHESQTIFNGFTGTLINEVNLSADWCGGSFSNVGTGTAYAVLTDNDEGKKTLTFKYGVQTPDNQTSWGVTNTGTSYPGWYEAQNMPQRNITKVVFDPSFAVVRPQSCYSWFKGCGGLTTIEGIVNLNTSEVANMKNMFYECTSLTSLDVSHFNTSKVTDLSYMFYYCNGLTSLDVSHFNTEKVTRIDGMFYRCSELTSLDVSHFNTSKVENMYAMFEKCESLTSLDVSHFNTSQVTEMDWMFYECSSLTNLDVSHFDTRKVTNMSSMFQDCSGLTSLDLSSFNTGNVTDIKKMFWGCSNLTSLAIGKDFTVGSGTTITDMFDGCTALPEGKLIMMVTGTTAPGIAQDIFGVFADGTLITNLTKEQLGITDTSSPYTWKGGTFKSVGGVSVQYLDENGVPQTADNALPITAISSELPGGWYYAEDNVNLNHDLQFTGGAHLILCDGAEMKVNGGWGIDCNNGSLAIYGQSSGNNMGSLTAIGERTGIRCEGLTIANCQVNAEGIINTGIYSVFENFTISGARVTVSGSSGIYSYGLTVTNSIVTAQGAGYGIFINNSDNIIVNNGEIYATGGDIGIRYSGPFIFNGGKIEAISTGTGTFHSQYGIDGNNNFIIGWSDPDNDYIYANSYMIDGTGSVKIADGKAMKAFIPAATEGESDKPFAYIAGGHTLTATELTALAGKKLVPNPDGLTYMDWDDSQKKLVSKNTLTDGNTANDFVYVLQGGAGEDHSGFIYTELPGGWYVAEGEVSYTSQLKFTGDAHLILADKAVMTVGTEASPIDDHAIYGNNASIAIYGQSTDDNTMGSLTATSGDAGIYAFSDADDANIGITINGGLVEATSTNNYSSGGIHVESNKGTAKLTINGGITKANGKSNSGIFVDSSNGSANVSITINGGKIETTGKGENIYAFSGAGTANVTINDGEVKATGGSGICVYSTKDAENDNATVTINGGKVTITSIICGIYAFSGAGTANVKINGGKISTTLNPKENSGVYGIHAQSYYGTANVTISGGEVTATDTGIYNVYGIYAEALEDGTANVIIDDGKVNVKSIFAKSSSPSGNGNATVTINGGEVSANKFGIHAANFGYGNANMIINGGQVEAIGIDDYGISASSGNGTANVTINGGQVTATDTGIYNSYGIYAEANNSPAAITITGGQVEAKGNTDGIYNEHGDITMSLTSNGEYIKANSYYASGSVKIPAGKALGFTNGHNISNVMGRDDTDYIFGDGSNYTLNAIAGWKLLMATTVPLGSGTDYYEAYCSTDGDYRLAYDVKAYAVTGYDLAAASVTLSESPLEGLVKGIPLILMNDVNGDGSPDDYLGNTLQLVGTTAAEASSIEGSVPTNISPLFTAGDGTKKMADLLYDATGSTDTSDYLAFVLEKGVFKPVAFSDSSVPAAGACILFVNKLDVLLMIQNAANSTSSARQRGIPFDLGGGTTGIERPTPSPSLNGGEIYDLQGRRLDQAPKAKGVYIRNGILVVIK